MIYHIYSYKKDSKHLLAYIQTYNFNKHCLLSFSKINIYHYFDIKITNLSTLLFHIITGSKYKVVRNKARHPPPRPNVMPRACQKHQKKELELKKLSYVKPRGKSSTFLRARIKKQKSTASTSPAH